MSSSSSSSSSEKVAAAIRKEAESWVIPSQPRAATRAEIPVLDLGPFFSPKSDADRVRALTALASQLREACTKAGFHFVKNHGSTGTQQLPPGVPESLLREQFAACRAFHSLPLRVKSKYMMDGSPTSKGVGYLHLNNRKLPARRFPNANEAFITKRDDLARGSVVPWPTEREVPGFRAATLKYTRAMIDLSKKMLPIYARALDLKEDYFDEYFALPFYRMRQTRYPVVVDALNEDSGAGIAPHVDTSFFTVLAVTGPGLVVWSESSSEWVAANPGKGELVVNTGELLKRLTNDKFLATRHLVPVNRGPQERFSLPFFFNAQGDVEMSVFETCCSADDPPKYGPTSYFSSQAAAQGE